ncbi:hypothetical protein DYH09_33705, partial [bacterium CPR1]|nr:hypothetical protein [bacterium CPR1]
MRRPDFSTSTPAEPARKDISAPRTTSRTSAGSPQVRVHRHESRKPEEHRAPHHSNKPRSSARPKTQAQRPSRSASATTQQSSRPSAPRPEPRRSAEQLKRQRDSFASLVNQLGAAWGAVPASGNSHPGVNAQPNGNAVQPPTAASAARSTVSGLLSAANHQLNPQGPHHPEDWARQGLGRMVGQMKGDNPLGNLRDSMQRALARPMESQNGQRLNPGQENEVRERVLAELAGQLSLLPPGAAADETVRKALGIEVQNTARQNPPGQGKLQRPKRVGDHQRHPVNRHQPAQGANGNGNAAALDGNRNGSALFRPSAPALTAAQAGSTPTGRKLAPAGAGLAPVGRTAPPVSAGLAT